MRIIVQRAIVACVIFFISSCQKSERNESSHESPTGSVVDSSATVYRSTDGGSSWQSFASGIPKEATVSAFLVGADQRLFAATDYHGLYAVHEGERHWSRVDSDLPEDVDINALVLMTDALVIGTHRHGVLVSRNGGVNWVYSGDRIPSSVRSLYFKNDILFAGADNGIYRSVDRGNSWTNVMKGTQVNGFTALGNDLYAALSNGAAKSVDEGRTWLYVYDNHTLHDISSDGKSVYAMTLGDGLLRSLDQGSSWQRLNNGLGTFNLYTFEVKPFHQRIFAAQWHGIYEWNEKIASWSKVTVGLPDSTAFTTLETTRRGLIAGIGLRN